MRIPIPLPVAELIPPVDLFVYNSDLHGQTHVGRVMIHAFRLLQATGADDEARRLWAAVYLHDIARTHDDRCYVHGERAVKRLDSLPDVQALFARGGVTPEDYPAIATAVYHHCLPEELPEEHPHRRLTALLKDADGLDRVRLGDLNPATLRYQVSVTMVPFAQDLYEQTDGVLTPGRKYFARLCAVARALEGSY